ncbi:hypothetical protein Bca4012_098129 [Brassica carinata]
MQNLRIMNLSQKQPFETQPVKTRSVTLRRPAPKSTLPLHSSRQSSRYVGFMDIETYTNPADRAVHSSFAVSPTLRHISLAR